MARSPKRDLKALRNLVTEAHDMLRTVNLPDQRSQRTYELLTVALSLIDDLMEQTPAAVLGAKGGKETAKRGSEYFRQIAAKRKTHGGGRSAKQAKPN